jgi:hypothetical protein
MHRARLFVAARRGAGARVSEVNSNSNIDLGVVTNRRRWLAIVGAIEGKLVTNISIVSWQGRQMSYFRTRTFTDFRAASKRRLSSMGDWLLRRSLRRSKRGRSSSSKAIEHTVANFWWKMPQLCTQGCCGDLCSPGFPKVFRKHISPV